jgi:CheY-like chemotaxis protein/HPt (histidine-containing phosphotransfer) domain-containing protein
MRETHILVVEDDPVSRTFLAQALASLPAHVDAAGSIAGAERFASAKRHDLWLVDAHLPDGDGGQCLQRLRAIRADVPALAVTAEAFADDLARLSASGFFEVVQKPVSVAALLAAVRRALGQAPRQTPIEPGQKLPPWDEAAALAALAGNATALATLRKLFFAELPGEQRLASDAFDRGDVDGLRAVLHRLQASCGFVGAARLRGAAQRWSEAPLDPARRQRFEWAAEDLFAAQD